MKSMDPFLIERIVRKTGSMEELMKHDEMLAADPELRHYISQLRAKDAKSFREYINALIEATKAAQPVDVPQPEELPQPVQPLETTPDSPRRLGSPWSTWGRFAAAASVILVAGYFGVTAYTSDQRINHQGDELADNIRETLSIGHQGDGSTGLPLTDTLCNCGEAGLRDGFYAGNDPGRKIFESNLAATAPTDAYETQCRKYWRGWLYHDRKEFTKAQEELLPLWESLSPGELRGRTSAVLMAVLWKNGEKKQLREVATETLKETEEYSAQAHNLAKRYLEIL